MDEILMNVNWMAVIAGAVIGYVAGWFWYSPKLFGNTWAKGVGVKMQKNMEGAGKAMLAQAVWVFLLAWIVGLFALTGSYYIIALITVGVIAFNKASGFWTKKSHAAMAIESGYVLLLVLITIAAHSVL